MKNIVLSAVAVLAMSSFAVAGGDIAPVEPVVEDVVVPSDSGFYLGLGYSYMMSDIAFRSAGVTYDLGNDYNDVMVQAGYKINSYVAIEGRYWKSVSDESFNIAGLGGNWDGDAEAYGIYVKPMYPVTDDVDVYALLGYGYSSIDMGGGVDFENDGFSWGIGASYAFNENVSIFLDYVAFDDNNNQAFPGIGNSDNELDTVNFGVTYKF